MFSESWKLFSKAMGSADEAMDAASEACDAAFKETESQFSGGVCITNNNGHVVITGPVKSLRINDSVIERPPQPGQES